MSTEKYNSKIFYEISPTHFGWGYGYGFFQIIECV